MKLVISCTNCNTSAPASQWWGLNNYYGISGHFCALCYDLVSHDSYGNPNYPTAYREIRDKQTLAKISARLKK